MAVTTYTVMGGEVLGETRGGEERVYLPDPSGSVAALIDSSQNITDEWEYWPYGEVRSHVGSSETPFTYLGTLGYHSDGAGRYYVRARVLDARDARWTTVDPLWPEEPAYGYVGGNPATRTDPSGMQTYYLPRWGRQDVGAQNESGRASRRGFCFENNLPQLLWCRSCLNRHRVGEATGDNDKHLHCVSGCLANIRCGTPCSNQLGTLKELSDSVLGGTVSMDDAVATDDGWDLGEKYPGGLRETAYCKFACRQAGWGNRRHLVVRGRSW
jgi:RHS repeat-associated protein